ncbi:helix-turn-helix transcriptional regulator [Pseudorhodoplanes sp.]|uniref:helix-turn-helix transcriptional regulator n=1 Tax=Pseudorhodoplanes sp. TaxID=1934341 RepID=UPI00391B4BA7
MRFERALSFLDRCTTATDLAALIEEFHRTIEAFGFTSCACGAWIGIGNARHYRFFFNSWPQAWIDIYTQQNFFPDDPFVQESQRTVESYLWSELEQKQQLTPRGREIYEVTRQFGWTEVMGIPVHGPSDYQGLVSIATMQEVGLGPRDRAFLELVGHAIHNRCRKETGFGLSPDLPKLTPRELECMRWVAIGKTNWEIGQVLGISPSTVHFHVEGAKKKLNKTTRTEAVAVLVLHGLI